jgi:hypothetical protein
MRPVQWDQNDHARSARYVRQDWEKLIEAAEAAILKRSRSLTKPSGNNLKEQDAITRALHILSMLR